MQLIAARRCRASDPKVCTPAHRTGATHPHGTKSRLTTGNYFTFALIIAGGASASGPRPLRRVTGTQRMNHLH